MIMYKKVPLFPLLMHLFKNMSAKANVEEGQIKYMAALKANGEVGRGKKKRIQCWSVNCLHEEENLSWLLRHWQRHHVKAKAVEEDEEDEEEDKPSTVLKNGIM